jgi:hypothetical protein
LRTGWGIVWLLSMSIANPPLPEKEPCALPEGLSHFIRTTVQQFFGNDSIVRNYGTDPEALRLHVETTVDDRLVAYDCLGVLVTRLDHIPHLEVSVRGTKVRGDAKIAYRQGKVL